MICFYLITELFLEYVYSQEWKGNIKKKMWEPSPIMAFISTTINEAGFLELSLLIFKKGFYVKNRRWFFVLLLVAPAVMTSILKQNLCNDHLKKKHNNLSSLHRLDSVKIIFERNQWM